jgi:chromosome segregation ATPase
VTRDGNYDALVASRAAKKDATRNAIVAAMDAIERELAEHGFYPANDGKITLTEVLSRAGVGTTTLRNKHHHGTRDLVQEWLRRLSTQKATTKPKARKAASEKIAWFEDALRKVNAEALKWRTERAALIMEIQDLRSQIEKMRACMGSNVVGIRSRDDTSR